MRSESLEYEHYYQGKELVSKKFEERARKLCKIRYDMVTGVGYWTRTCLKSLPSSQGRSVSIKDELESSPDVAGGETGEDGASSKEAKGQVAVTLKKMKRVKGKSPIQTGRHKRKRSELASHHTPGLPVFFFILTHNLQGIPDITYGSNEEIKRERQRLQKGSALKEPGSGKKVAPTAPRMSK